MTAPSASQAPDYRSCEGTAWPATLAAPPRRSPHLATHAAHPRPPGTARIARRHCGVRARPGARPSAGAGRRADAGGGGIAAALAARYGVTRQADWPLAPIRLAALGVDPGAAYWLAADPVTLAVGRSDVRLAGVVDDLSRDRRRRAGRDAERALRGRRPHVRRAAARCVLRPRHDERRVCRRIRRARRWAALSTAAPRRRRRRRLAALASEIQMLLHEHPVNIERERAGRAPANSVWFSCGGTMPQPPVPAVSIRTFAAAGIAAALAAHAGSPARALPGHLGAAREDAGGAESIVVALEPALDVAALERTWAAPARDALAARRVRRGDAARRRQRATRSSGTRAVPGVWQRFAGRSRAARPRRAARRREQGRLMDIVRRAVPGAAQDAGRRRRAPGARARLRGARRGDAGGARPRSRDAAAVRDDEGDRRRRGAPRRRDRRAARRS